MARIETRFGSHRRFVSLWAWLILWPTDGPFPADITALSHADSLEVECGLPETGLFIA